MRFLRLCLLFSALGISSILPAQNGLSFWKPASTDVLPQTEQGSVSQLPTRFTAFKLDYTAMASFLKTAPMEFTTQARTQALVLDLPGNAGATQQFLMRESPVMAPELGAKYPEIRTYYGEAVDGSGTSVRLGVGYKGFYAYIFAMDGTINVIRPVVADRPDLPYLAYDMNDLPADAFVAPGTHCGVEDAPIGEQPAGKEFWPPQAAADRDLAPVELRKYRIAIAAKAEYSIFHGGTKPLVMSAIVEALNFIVAIQERDFAVRLELIPNNDTMIFLDPATDPYNGNLDTWISQNHTAMVGTLGSANFDVGHVFGVSIPGEPIIGLAQRPSVCKLFGKGRGGSSAPMPIGAYFYLVAAHELCHQLSGTHTWNNCTVDLEPQQEPSTAYEPGSGTTIMSYAGSCGSNDVVSNNNNERYYHAASIEQVKNYISQDDGATCGTLVPTGNNQPSASIPLSNGFYIPISTPFQLTGVGSDPDGDALTYCWEEFDKGPITPLGQPVGTSPLFRSFLPTASPTRVFPRLNILAANQMSVSEVLPTISRLLTFRMTVRDNHAGGGGVEWAQMNFNSTAQAGPFLVTSPNTSGQIWDVGTFQTVTWDVANTDKAPVNCQTVNIRLSTDGGLTYPVTLASGVPNTGKYCVVVPANVTTTARIRVDAADNIFFDISNANLKIQQPQQAGYTLCPGALNDIVCLPDPYTTQVSTSAVLSFSTPITLSISGLPVGATATFSPNPVLPGNNSTLTVNFLAGTPESLLDLTVSGNAGGAAVSSVISLHIIRNDFSAFALQTPVDGASGIDYGPSLHWNGVPDADLYEVQLATNPAFEAGSIVASKFDVTVDSFKVAVALDEGQTYYWRVRPVNDCNNANWSEPFVFVTKVQTCVTLTANDLPKTISANGTPTVESKITVLNGGILSDVNVLSVAGNHTFFKDLEARLISPAGTDVLLWKDKCPGSFNFNIGFDDVAAGAFGCPPPNNSAITKPSGVLGNITGENATGVWTLRVKDNVVSSGGQLTGFQLQLCSSSALNGPFIVNNNVLQLAPGGNATVSTDLLKTDDANNADDQLTYTLITVPDHGLLQRNGATLKVGDQFNQTAINNNELRYYDYGLNAGDDDFRFAVTDGEGGMVSSTFHIEPFPVGTKTPLSNLAFALSPNPANETIRLSFSETLESDTRILIFNAAGQQLRAWTLASGTSTILLNISDLPEGVYAVSVQNEKGSGVKKVVVR